MKTWLISICGASFEVSTDDSVTDAEGVYAAFRSAWEIPADEWALIAGLILSCDQS